MRRLHFFLCSSVFVFGACACDVAPPLCALPQELVADAWRPEDFVLAASAASEPPGDPAAPPDTPGVPGRRHGSTRTRKRGGKSRR